MTITQTVDIPADRWLKIKVPNEVPAGKTILAFTPAAPNSMAAAKEGVSSDFKSPKEKATPRADALLGILSHVGDISPEEIRAERLAKYQK